jgi:hypothetical protein
MVFTGSRRPGKRPQMIFDSSGDHNLSKGFTLILCFSRLWCFRKFFVSFEKMKIDLDNCNLLIIDNSDDRRLRDALHDRAKEYAGSFRTVRLYKTWRIYQRPMITAKKIKWENSQLAPIYGMHMDAMRLCRTRRFVMMEDDTLAPPETIPRLLELLDENPNCAMATAIQAMRQQQVTMPTYMGIYYVEREGTQLIWWASPSPNLKGVHKIDGAGWYCFASYKDIFLKADKKLARETDGTRHFAADLQQVNNIRQMGYDVLADFGLWTKHISKYGKDFFHWGKKQCRPHLCVWVPEWQCYARAGEMKEPIHYKLVGRLTRQKDRS